MEPPPRTPDDSTSSPTGASSADASPLDDARRALSDAARSFAEIRAFAGQYAAAKLDAVRLSVRRMLLFAALGVLGLLGAVAALATAVVLLFVGVAGGIGRLFGPGHEWLGQIIVGAVTVVAVVAGTLIAIRWITRTSWERTVQRYETRATQQRADFGRDAAEWTAAAGRVAN